MNLEDPGALLLEVSRLLEESALIYGVYGGMALAVYGTPRETKDVDHAVRQADLEEILKAIQSRFPDGECAFRKTPFGGLFVTRITVIGGGDSESGLNTIDLLSPRDSAYTERALARRIFAPFRGKDLAFLAPEDFILFKILSTRDRDLEDAASVLGHSDDLGLDLKLIEDEAEALGKMIPGHPIAQRWAKVKSLSSEDHLP